MTESFTSESTFYPSLKAAGRAQPQRVALVAPSLDILGGQGVQARELAKHLRLDGYEVIFVPINPVFPRGIRWMRRVPYLRTLVNLLLYVPSLGALRGADVVHVFSASYWSFLLAPVPAILAARLLRKRVVLNYHSGEADDHLRNWGRRVHPFLKLAHEIVVPSRYLESVFERHGYHARVVRNIVDTSHFAFRLRRPLRPRLLSTRNFEPHYRVDRVIRAYALIKRRFPEATLTIAGYGSEESKLRRLAATLVGDGIRFVGRVPPEAVPQLYDQADVYLNASVIDNQPLSILEAFAAGMPVISTATGDITHMINDGVNGCLVPRDDTDALAEAVCALLHNEETAVAMALRAREEVQRYTWPRVRPGWAAAYAGNPG